MCIYQKYKKGQGTEEEEHQKKLAKIDSLEANFHRKLKCVVEALVYIDSNVDPSSSIVEGYKISDILEHLQREHKKLKA